LVFSREWEPGHLLIPRSQVAQFAFPVLKDPIKVALSVRELMFVSAVKYGKLLVFGQIQGPLRRVSVTGTVVLGGKKIAILAPAGLRRVFVILHSPPFEV
jgi:hypothetical protein